MISQMRSPAAYRAAVSCNSKKKWYKLQEIAQQVTTMARSKAALITP
jgi:hypothetical protein